MSEEKKLIVKAWAESNIGHYRKQNQDNFYMDGKHVHQKDEDDYYEFEIAANVPQLYAVFDGLGGEEGGQESSITACEVMASCRDEILAASKDDLREAFSKFATIANNEICKKLGATLYPKGGTTFVAVRIEDGIISPFYLGDSRIYLFYNDSLYIATEDHTVAMEQYKKGEKTYEQAMASKENHILTHFLGDQPNATAVGVAESQPVYYEDGISILLCSDGLHDMVTADEIGAVLGGDFENPAQTLVQLALHRGGFDNCTVIVIKFEEKKQ